jgi:hypothetical protein
MTHAWSGLALCSGPGVLTLVTGGSAELPTWLPMFVWLAPQRPWPEGQVTRTLRSVWHASAHVCWWAAVCSWGQICMAFELLNSVYGPHSADCTAALQPRGCILSLTECHRATVRVIGGRRSTRLWL